MTIDELDWYDHPSGSSGEQAKIRFPNGYGASVIRGGLFFYTDGGTYEIAVLDRDGITYETPITDDVLGYQSEDEANAVLKAIEELPPL